MEDLYFKEIFEYPIKEFKKHLTNSINERIVFSGKYGIGKTKFLADFFSPDNQIALFGTPEYLVYRLYPINYSIASNEDIIRYIKYDIIVEMLNQQSISFDKIELNLIDTLPEYAKRDLHKITAALVYMIPKLGKEVVECFEKFDKLKEEFLKFHKESNRTSEDKLVEYLESLELKEGSIYESDITTKIISETISTTGKKSVLLIDDIDRLDPEHVFRILNVFASHFDSIGTTGYKNKFNFDKIIIVCDFNNIRNLFHHRYGSEVDFMGYIDKFYSSEVYHFDNKKAIIGIVNRVFDSIILGEGTKETEIVTHFNSNNRLLSNIISLLIARGFLSLRSIVKLFNKNVDYHHEQIDFWSRKEQVNAWSVPVCVQLKLLRDFFGEYQSMKKTLGYPSLTGEYIPNFQSIFGDFLYILSYAEHKFYPQGPFLFTFQNIPVVLDVKLKFTDDSYQYVSLFNYGNEMNGSIPVKGDPLTVTEDMFWAALNDTLELLHKKSYL